LHAYGGVNDFNQDIQDLQDDHDSDRNDSLKINDTISPSSLFMKALVSLVKIIRPGNALMAAITVVLGFWLSGSRSSLLSLMQMVVAAVCAVGYGNVVNDIVDVDSDRISHPDRPLPKNDLSLVSAVILAFFLFSFSFVNGFLVSTVHGIGTVIPLALLSLYAFFLKATPLVGNVSVSLLVAYTIVFGGLSAPMSGRLFIPALLAFFLNCCREIIKDVQDEPGDKAAGIKTTAIVPKSLLKSMLIGISVVYAGFLFLPFFLKQFGIIYCILCGAVALPLHCYWVCFVLKKNWLEYLGKISLIIKIEMLAGLLALAFDQAYLLL
jgi:geranylgeranylglycerol-phosphate geranylgeranyltransferase